MTETALGSVIDRKYRLVAELGRGAMGVVYRAEQLDVEGQARRQVALKTLRPEFSADANFTRRFLREIGVAMQLRSPYIVTIHDCGKDEQGQLYYAMEWLPQTLKEWVTEQGSLSVAQVVHIVGQLCEGLAEAHGLAEPVVHRDLKPANIFVEQRQDQLQVKIGDFGIAKVVGEHTDGLTHSGAVSPGTPRYMAPEQWKGDAVDGRTDLYALGVLFYELLTGNPPFTGSGGVSVLMAQHLHQPPPPLPDSIPGTVRDLVMRLLAKTPAARPADALRVKRELVAMLQDASNLTTELRQPGDRVVYRGELSDTRIVAPAVPQAQRESVANRVASSESPAPAQRRWLTRRHWMSGLIALLVLGLGLIASLRFPSLFPLITHHSLLVTEEAQPPLPLPDKSSLIVLPFTNISNDPSQDYFSDGITEDITSDLSKISSLFVISRNSAFTYKGKATKVQEISREMGVRYVLEGSVRRADSQVRITAQLIDATTDHHVWSERYDRPLKDVFALQDEIVQKIVTTLKLQLTLMEQGFLVRKRTDNLEAYDYVLRGVESYWRAWNETKKEAIAQARQMFEKAIELDQTYADAYAGLGATYWIEWFMSSNKSPQTLERAGELARQAMAVDESLSAPHTLLGSVYLWQKQHDLAIREAERAIALNPNGAEGYMTLGGILAWAGRPEEGVQMAERGIRLNPRSSLNVLLTLGFTYRIAGRYEEAIAIAKKILARQPNFAPAYFLLAYSYAQLNRLDEARAAGAEFQRLVPFASLEEWRQKAAFKDPAMLERDLAALRKAGWK